MEDIERTPSAPCELRHITLKRAHERFQMLTPQMLQLCEDVARGQRYTYNNNLVRRYVAEQHAALLACIADESRRCEWGEVRERACRQQAEACIALVKQTLEKDVFGASSYFGGSD